MPDPPLHNEKVLIANVALGDRNAYTILYMHYYPKLYQYVFFVNKSHEDSEEIIQNCLFRVWERKETLIGIRSFENYLFRMAKNELFDVGRRSRLRDKVQQATSYAKSIDDHVVEKQITYNIYLEAAIEAIGLLPPRKQEIFLLSSQNELSLDEIAALLVISRSLVKKELYASVKFIKSYLDKNADWLVIMAICTFI